MAKATLAALVLFAVALFGYRVRAQTSDVSPVIIDYFFEAGCADCFRVRDQVLPELRERCEGFYVLNRHDVEEETNVIRLIAYQEKLGIAENKPVSMVVDYRYVFNGFDAIKTGLLARVEGCVMARLEPGWTPPAPIDVKPEAGSRLADDRLRRFTLSAVIAAGLIDGLNPCAISTLVFFMSLLGVAKVRGRGLLTMGVSFCAASFLAYAALGFGLLRAVHLFTGFPVIRFAVDMVMMALLGLFAYLSFRDAYRYRKTGDAKDVTLQLPDAIKRRIHGIMRAEVGGGMVDGRWLMADGRAEGRVGRPGLMALAAGGFVVGTAVTALESVCTGQVYAPTLVLVIKSGGLASQAWSYLLLYNVMFIVPLVLVFALTFMGMRTQTLLEWSKRNVVFSKVLLGTFFLATAILIGVL